MKDNFDEAVLELQESILEEAKKIYSEKAIQYFLHPRNFGRMNDPDASAIVKGSCGDTMEIYLVIKDDKISSISFYTDGCGSTLACGSSVTELAKEKNIKDILKISPSDVIEDLGGLPDEALHCSILAVITLLKSVADYFLKT